MTPIPIAEKSSSTPLSVLSAVSLDTETTGLDTSIARIIQIGAVRLVKGALDDVQVYDQLVRPEVEIPAATTAIHGLTDEDVVGAPTFSEIAENLNNWIGSAIWLGYSIGFDLAIFDKEFERAQLNWTQPRALDVRHLVSIIDPNLPNFALETVAAWLGVGVKDRHNALADAVITANVFLGLLPLLREKGIFTLAEAEAACREIIYKADIERAAGWREAVMSQSSIEKSFGALARIDSFPYRHRVSEIMSAPVVTVGADTNIGDVLSKIIDNRISSVLVQPGKKGEGLGIITERDILREINSAPTRALKITAGELSVRPVDSVSGADYVYRAISHMSRMGYRHLGVTGSDDRIVGIVTSRDLLKQRASDAISLGEEIFEAQTAEDLAIIWGQLALVAAGLIQEEVDPRDVAAVISRELCALTQHACEIASREMIAAGEGEAPVPYAVFVLGSGGRGESMLAMDQDNALVYAENDSENTIDDWFAKLGSRIADILHLAGVPYCSGGIMAKNTEWRMPVERWKSNVSNWIGRHKPQDLLSTDIFFDAVAVHGEKSLCEDVLRHAFDIGGQSRNFLKLMSLNAADFHVPLGMFGRFQLKDGRMDLKRGGIMPIFSTARVLAVRHGVRALSTPARLQAVRDKEDVNADAIDRLIDAHKVLLGAILGQQLVDIRAGIPPSNRVDPKSLSGTSRDQLKWVLRQVDAVTGLLGNPITYQ